MNIYKTLQGKVLILKPECQNRQSSEGSSIDAWQKGCLQEPCMSSLNFIVIVYISCE